MYVPITGGDHEARVHQSYLEETEAMLKEQEKRRKEVSYHVFA